MRNKRPLRLIVEKEMVPIPNPPDMIGTKLGGQAHVMIDHLECGHEFQAKLLMPKSKTPYVRKDGETYRKCLKCPRVT